MRIVLVIFSAVLLISIVEAQKKPNITKPVVDLQKRPRPPVWNRPPEERRKLSIFPKTNMKFVVTPKTVKNDDTAKLGLPTKRPLMRKFIIQDKNEEGTWSFAPREPLMKTNRFTVTLAPPKPNRQEIDEMESEESKKVNTIVNKPKMEQESRNHRINKGNLIESTKNRKKYTPVSSTSKVDEQKLEVDYIIDKTIVNDTRDVDIMQKKDSSTLTIDKVPANYSIDIRSIDSSEDLNQNENKPVESTQTEIHPHIKQSTGSIESRSLEVNQINRQINQNENNKLNLDNQESKPSQILPLNDLEIVLEKIVNNSESANYNTTSGLNENIMSTATKSETNHINEDIPKFDVTKPNTFYDIISIEHIDNNNTNFEESITGDNGEIHTASETNALGDKEDIAENLADSLLVGNLENLSNFMEKEAENIQNRGITNDQRENIVNNRQTIKKNVTETGNFTKELQSNNSQELALEIYESNIPINSEEVSAEILDEEKDAVVDEPMTGNLNLKLNESFNINNSMAEDEFPNESISDTSNNYPEERSNESLIDTSNNFTGEEISNESSSNMAGEELSNESYPDKSNNLTEENSNESVIETSSSFTGEEISNESLSNMGGEELSNESSYPDKSDNLTGEISNESIIEASNNLTSEEISNASSNIAGEDISNETNLDNSNLTEDNSNDSIIEIPTSSTVEEIPNESSSNMAGEAIPNDNRNKSINFLEEKLSFDNLTEISEELMVDSSEILIDKRISDVSVKISQDAEIAEEALKNRFKRSNNIIEEEDLPTTVSGFKYTGHEVRLNHDLSFKNINA